MLGTHTYHYDCDWPELTGKPVSHRLSWLIWLALQVGSHCTQDLPAGEREFTRLDSTRVVDPKLVEQP